MAEFVNEATLKEEQEEVRPGPNAAPIICRTKLQNTAITKEPIVLYFVLQKILTHVKQVKWCSVFSMLYGIKYWSKHSDVEGP